MRRTLGGSAGFLALLAVVLHTQFGGDAERTASSPTANSKPSPPTAQSDQPVDGPWIATQAFFNVRSRRAFDPAKPVPRETRELLATLTSSDGVIQDPGKLRDLLGVPADLARYSNWSIITTAADPRHTRLSLFFDRQIEAIERSLQPLGWEFATQWLPWNDPFNSEENDIGERRHQRWLERQQEEFPGVLVFRHAPEHHDFPPRALFVFIVPETPISGINGPSFFAAMRLAQELSTGKNQIGLLAPSFSGSFDSLARALDACAKNSWTERHALHPIVYGGSISSREHAEAFANKTHLTFYSGIAATEDYETAFKHLIDLYQIPRDQAAYLVEDESAFSGSFATPPHEGDAIPRFVFPRDIDHLRNAYRDAVTGPGGDRQSAPGAAIDFSIKDPNVGEDGIPTFSDKQTPLSQDAAVAAITSELKRRHTRMVYIAATNSLDALFLARLVRQNSPDVRVLFGSGEILFVTAATDSALTGTLFLSTYPMFFSGDDWLDRLRMNRDRIQFAAPEFQGFFNVTQMLVAGLGAARRDQLELRGYGQFRDESPQSAGAHPGLWLLSLTRSGVRPIDLLDENDAQHSRWFNETLASNPLVPQDEPPPFEWRLTVILLSVAIFAGSFVLLGCNVDDLVSRPMWLALTDGYPYRLLALLGACLSASALEWLLSYPVWRAILLPASRQNLSTVQIWIAALAALAFLAPVLTLAYIVYRKWREGVCPHELFGFGIRGAIYAAVTISVFLVVIATWANTCVQQRTEATAFLFRYRALEIFSGVSPALPLAILSVQFFLFSMFYFKRYTRAGLGRPRLSLVTLDWPALKHRHEELEKQVLAPVRLDWPEWLRRTLVAILAVGASLVVLDAAKDVKALEVWPYNAALLAALGLALFSIAVNCYDLTMLWRHVRRMLAQIELLPLKTALERVSRDWPRQPIWAFHRSVSRQLLDQQMLHSLHDRQVLGRPQQAPMVQASAGHATAATAAPLLTHDPSAQFARFVEVTFHPHRDNPKPNQAGHFIERQVAALQEYEIESCQIAQEILVDDLAPVWRASVNEDLESTDDYSKQPPAQKFLRHSSDFVMLQLSRYIVYTVEQTRRIMLHISVGFLMLTLVLSSYPLQGPLAVSRFVAVLFLAVGLVVVRVLAGMERHPILSKISRTKPGELNREFWVQLITVGALPLVGVLAHLFPSISRFLFSWVAPSVEALH